MSDQPNETEQPAQSGASLRISGGATPQEVAAVVSVLASLRVEEPPRRPQRRWGSPSWDLCDTPLLIPGPGTWKTSRLPRT